MGMHARITLAALLLAAPVLTGCIAGDADGSEGLPGLTETGFTVGQFVQDLEHATGASLVNARVDSLQVEYNQTGVSLVEWRSFTRQSQGCDLVSTMVYEGSGRSGGFQVYEQGEPCPLSLHGTPTVAEVVALVDRVPLPMVQNSVLGGEPVFSIALAGYCGYAEGQGEDDVYVWNGAGVVNKTAQVQCGGGANSGLALTVTVPQHPGKPGPAQRYVILEQVPSR